MKPVVLYLVYLAGAIIGAATWALFHRGETCPRIVLGYDCHEDVCDHSKSLLYTNMATMAKNAEKRDGNNNLWGGS